MTADMTADFDISDLPCPVCSNPFTHYRRCSEFDCEDGVIFEDDGINDWPVETCDTCHGTGWEKWCPKCGKDLTEMREELIDATETITG